MKCTITVRMDNAAFDGNEELELCMVLGRAIERIKAGAKASALLDSNGNSVGKVEIK